MSILHICCNLAGSTVFPQMFEALRDEGLSQIVFVPEKRAGDVGKNVPQGVRSPFSSSSPNLAARRRVSM